MLKKPMVISGLFFLLWCFSVHGAIAGNDQALGETLSIMHKNGDISDKTYREITQKYKADNPEKTELTACWNNGMRLDSADKSFRLRFGGRILNDWGSITADRNLENFFDGQTLEGTGTQMRHARFYMSGTLYEAFTFKADYDFAGTDADFKDVWIGMKNIAWLGELRVGHQKEPFSMETMNSLPNTVFMERGLSAAFVPGRNSGVKIHNSIAGGSLGWGVGAYKEVGTSDGFDDRSDYNLTARITGVPLKNDDGTALLHLGMAYSHKFYDEDESIRYRSRPESNLSDVYTIDTGAIDRVTGVDLVGPEIAVVYGPFCFQSEYVYSALNRTSADNLKFSGYYAFCGYFLTGETRPYKTDEAGGEFGRVMPDRPFAFNSSGWGAWQVAVRYSAMDLNDKEIQGGEEENCTFGLNWFINPNLRMTANYVLARIDDRDTAVSGKSVAMDNETLRIFMMRFQVDF